MQQLQEEAAGELLWQLEVDLIGIIDIDIAYMTAVLQGYASTLRRIVQEGKEGESLLM